MDGDLLMRDAARRTDEHPSAREGGIVRSAPGTVVYTTPVHEVPRARLELERVLPPGAAGPHGASYKLLRTQVLQRLAQLGTNTLAVISPSDGAGKTLTAINLAIAIAAERTRTVLLADLDLRRPGIASRLGLKVSVGVEDCLSGNRPVHEALFRLKSYDRLTVLPARAAVEHSAELLADPAMHALVDEMRHRYTNRIVIFDLPPVLESDDALVFSRLAGAGLLVIGESRTRREDVPRALELLPHLPIVGAVLNDSRETPHAGY